MLHSELLTLVDADGKPNVVLQIRNDEQIVLPLVFTPEEARQVAAGIVEIAEAAEIQSHLIAVLRGRKMDEYTISSIVKELMAMRDKPLDELEIQEPPVIG